jgi:hypothetical protein
MEPTDPEISDITIVIRTPFADDLRPVVARLKALGVEIEDINEDEGVIEGNVLAAKVAEIQKLPCVQSVRIDFTYVPDYPAGDSRASDAPPAV